MLVTSNVVTREEILAAIRELAATLERRPRLTEVCSALKVTAGRVASLFGSYTKALKASGLLGANSTAWRLTTEQLHEDWREVARRVGRVPTIYDYRAESRYSERPLRSRFGNWCDLPAAMLEFGDRKGLWAGWEDVRELTQRHVDERSTSTERDFSRPTLDEVDVKLTYGGPLVDSPMAMAPNNEMGVVLLFGALARKLGFVVLKLQPTDYPDCEALREVAASRWQRVRIEFEFESRNFQIHGHDPQECDLIVCWEHNWKGCALNVLELKRQIG
jgi:hypothetical protein